MYLARTLTIPMDNHGWFLESHPKLKPIDSSTEGIYLAGSAQGPKDIPQSVAQGSAAAGRAARVLNAGKWEIDPIVAYVDPNRCLNANPKGKCTMCAEACPYGAVINSPGTGNPSQIIPAKCHACGTCVAECPANAITQYHFTDGQILAQIHSLLADKPEEKVLAFTCRWCSGLGADNAGVSHFEYPANTRNIMVMCSGRVDADFVMEAYKLGAGAVLVSGCHPQDCHYITGRNKADARMDKVRTQLERMGMTPGRFRTEEVSATEGAKWAQIMKEMSAVVTELGPDGVKAENEKMRTAVGTSVTAHPRGPGCRATCSISSKRVWRVSRLRWNKRWRCRRWRLMAGVEQNTFLAEVMATRGGANVLQCYQCGTCSGSCPVLEDMKHGPRRILYMIQSGMEEEVLSSPDMWRCVSCYSCMNRCPRDIEITDLMADLRRIAMKKGYVDDKEAVFGQAFAETVAQNGRLFEPELLTRYYLARVGRR